MSIDLGAAIYIALKPILKIYTIIGVGFLLARYNIVSMETARGVSNMVVNAILPCLTFNKIVSNISDKDIKEVGVIVLSAMILFSVGSACAIASKYAMQVPKQWFWGLMFAGFFPNISDLPIAYVQSMSNGTVFDSSSVDKGVAYCCIFLMTQSFFMMNFGMWRVVGLDFRRNWDEEEESQGSENLPTDEESYSLGKPQQLKNSRQDAQTLDSNISEKAETAPGRFFGDNSHANSTQNLSLLQPQNARLRESSPSLEAYRTHSIFTSPDLRARTVDSHPSDSHTDCQTTKSFTFGESRSSLRRRRPSLNDFITEYSAAEQIRDGELDLSRPLTLTEELGNKNSTIGMSPADNLPQTESIDDPLSRVSFKSSKVQRSGKVRRFIARYKLSWVVYFLVKFIRPASLGASLGIIISMIPWVKACFVKTSVHVHNAPDGEPVLNFLMDFTSYIGNACVPLGLLLLGGTLARLQVKKLPKGILRVALAMTVFRLMVIPIIGVAWANKLYKMNWLDTVIGKFVMILTWSMPSATAQVYFTAFYTPLEGSHIQMDCLSIFFIMQYAVLFITVPFVITYTLKVDLKY